MPKPDATHGAGFASARANAIAELAAALLRDDRSAVAAACAELDAERRSGNSPVDGATIRARIEPLLKASFPRVVRAVALGQGGVGDLLVTTPNGTCPVEVKAQLEKPSLDDITQADWVRDETDALRFLAARDAAFRGQLAASTLSLLASDPNDFEGWTFEWLWLADVGLLCDAPARGAAGVRSPADLRAFLHRKLVLQLSAREQRLEPLASLPAVAAALAAPGSVTYRVKRNRASEAAVPVCVGGGKPVFTYHVYPVGYAADGAFCGRHKVHGRMFHH